MKNTRLITAISLLVIIAGLAVAIAHLPRTVPAKTVYVTYTDRFGIEWHKATNTFSKKITKTSYDRFADSLEDGLRGANVNGPNADGTEIVVEVAAKHTSMNELIAANETALSHVTDHTQAQK